MIAQVILVDKDHAVDSVFDYKIPDILLEKVNIGSRVIVPFGVRNNPTEALVIALTDTSSFPKLKTLIECPHEKPVCSQEQIDLCFYMQNRYLCSFKQAYNVVKPPHLGTKVQNFIIALPTDNKVELTTSENAFMETLSECGGIAEIEEIESILNKKGLKRIAYALKDMGLVDIRQKTDDTITPKYIRMVELNCSIDEAYAISDELRAHRAPVQADMILTLCENGNLSTADLVHLSEGNYTSLSSLCDKGIVSIYKKTVEREAYSAEKYTATVSYTPTDEQKVIIDYLNRSITHNIYENILLHGVTGSGKTEVFLQAIDTCIKNEKQAIVLVPEISLTPQMVERFVGRFGKSVAVIHSGLSQGERFDQWNKIRNGEVNVVVGARSAIFAPFDNIGIIILDEEHETSYKSETSPRYHAADIAMYRGRKHGAPVLLASATPSVISYYNAEQGIYKLFEMKKRYNENPLPKARIVDMRSELLDYHNTSVVSIRLQDEIRRNLERKEKTILFLNRRGYNTFVSCRECGHVLECDNCSIALTYHRKTNQLVCHYCGYTQENVTVCPECGSKYIKFFGTGTQKIEDELNTLFPDAKILRMDFDTTSQKGGHEAILDRFKSGEADILLGTQMVTKGLDFPDVTLVGVLAADSSLNIDDFRSGERCFSLITQVCGRAGRGDIDGRAVIQTYQPENSTINFAREQNYADFYQNEIVYRKRLDYPPFCDMVYILVSGENEELVKQEIFNIGEILKDDSTSGNNIISIIGPAPSPIYKIKNKFRHRILMKVKDIDKILPVLKIINEAHNSNRNKNSLVIDVNPINML